MQYHVILDRVITAINGNHFGKHSCKLLIIQQPPKQYIPFGKHCYVVFMNTVSALRQYHRGVEVLVEHNWSFYENGWLQAGSKNNNVIVQITITVTTWNTEHVEWLESEAINPWSAGPIHLIENVIFDLIDEIYIWWKFVTGCTRTCHFDNFWCCKPWKFNQNGISILVYIPHHDHHSACRWHSMNVFWLSNCCFCGKLWYLKNNCVGDTIVNHLASKMSL